MNRPRFVAYCRRFWNGSVYRFIAADTGEQLTTWNTEKPPRPSNDAGVALCVYYGHMARDGVVISLVPVPVVTMLPER